MIKIKQRDVIHLLDINRAGIYTQFSKNVTIYIKSVIASHYMIYFNHKLTDSQWQRLKYIVRDWAGGQGIGLSLENW